MTAVQWKARRQAVTFLALTLVLCLPPYYAIISAESIERIPDLAVIGLMWAPGAAALATRLVHQRNLRGFGWRPGPSRYLLVSYFLPVVAGLLVYGTVWLTNLGGFTAEGLVAGSGSVVTRPFWWSVLASATFGVLLESVLALGEELGWRGLLVPELAKELSFAKTACLSGTAWVLYHVPAILFAGYHSTAPVWYSLVVFSGSFMAISFVLAWICLRSASIWPAVVFHASHNLFIENVFDRLTVSQGLTQYVTTEFGLGLAVVYGVVAILCWRHRRELPSVGGWRPSR